MTETPVDEDAALIQAYRAGDDDALTALIQRHEGHVYRLALGVLASPQDAEDAAQEAFVAMFSSLHSFRGESAFSTWLYRLTLNTCLKRRARSKGGRDAPLPETDLPASPHAAPDAHARRAWLRDRVALFLAALPEANRLPVVLSDAVSLPAPRIAEVLGISLPAVKARLRRGRLRLRDEIERYCQETGLSGWRELVNDL